MRPRARLFLLGTLVSAAVLANGGAALACSIDTTSYSAEELRRQELAEARSMVEASNWVVIGVVRAGGGPGRTRYVIERSRVLRGRFDPRLFRTAKRGETSCGIMPRYGVDGLRSPMGDTVVVVGRRRGLLGVRADEVVRVRTRRGRDILNAVQRSQAAELRGRRPAR